MSDTVDGLIGLGILIGSFFVGKKVGHNISSNEYARREYERDIALLRQEVADMRKQKIANNPNVSP